MSASSRCLALVALLALAGCDLAILRPPPPDPGARLDGEGIRAALEGNSLVTDGVDEAPLSVFFPSYGEMRGLRGNSYRDSGTWHVTAEELCGDWENWWGTLDRCWRVHRAGDWLTLRRSEGGRETRARLVAGDATSH